jgi:hypothetical protein
MYPLVRRAADVALRAFASAPDQRPPFALGQLDRRATGRR